MRLVCTETMGVSNLAASLPSCSSGMVSRILFAWVQGSDLDNNAKQWRLVADGLNDLAMLASFGVLAGCVLNLKHPQRVNEQVEMLAPLFPEYFLALVCFASMAKAIVGVAGGATRAALTQHQARCALFFCLFLCFSFRFNAQTQVQLQRQQHG
jgi:hypothetical protein